MVGARHHDHAGLSSPRRAEHGGSRLLEEECRMNRPVHNWELANDDLHPVRRSPADPRYAKTPGTGPPPVVPPGPQIDPPTFPGPPVQEPPDVPPGTPPPRNPVPGYEERHRVSVV